MADLDGRFTQKLSAKVLNLRKQKKSEDISERRCILFFFGRKKR